MPHFDGKFIGVLPKRRSAISPENSADARPYKTPIWAPFFVVSARPSVFNVDSEAKVDID